MKYGSVCSGIEAASVAWEPLNWQPAWFAEIEPFPAAVLAHHWPDVPNLGDMTTIRDRITTGEIEVPDVLVGGTPCQAFSVAGLRNSLDDDRGQLTLEFVRLANAIDSRRAAAGLDRSIIVWENVPGVLNTKDNAFGCFLGALAGEGSELQPAGNKWTNAGCVYGPQRTIAWRVLDAQYFGVAQRRRRVFVVASARDGFDPAKVLFESEGVRRDSAPSREAWQSTTHDVAPSLVSSGRGVERVGETLGQDPVVAVPILEPGARTGKSTTDRRAGIGIGQDGEPMFTLQAGKQHGIAHSVALRGREGGATAELGGEVAGTLRASTGGGDKPHVLTQYGRELAGTLTRRHDSSPCADRGQNMVVPAIGWPEELTAHIELQGTIQRGGDGGRHDGVMQPDMAVRRLTPIECERLQGFPDNHTLIPWRNKPKDQCPDGPRYKALGNSMAVPVMHWIGSRIKRIAA